MGRARDMGPKPWSLRSVSTLIRQDVHPRHPGYHLPQLAGRSLFIQATMTMKWYFLPPYDSDSNSMYPSTPSVINRNASPYRRDCTSESAHQADALMVVLEHCLRQGLLPQQADMGAEGKVWIPSGHQTWQVTIPLFVDDFPVKTSPIYRRFSIATFDYQNVSGLANKHI